MKKVCVIISALLLAGCSTVAAKSPKGEVHSSGIASYYWQLQKTANGETFNPNAMTAAHKTIPFNTKIRVTNKRNGKSVVVRVNDRGPFIKGRVVDVSRKAAEHLGFKKQGLTPVTIHVIK